MRSRNLPGALCVVALLAVLSAGILLRQYSLVEARVSRQGAWCEHVGPLKNSRGQRIGVPMSWDTRAEFLEWLERNGMRRDSEP